MDETKARHRPGLAAAGRPAAYRSVGGWRASVLQKYRQLVVKLQAAKGDCCLHEITGRSDADDDERSRFPNPLCTLTLSHQRMHFVNNNNLTYCCCCCCCCCQRCCFSCSSCGCGFLIRLPSQRPRLAVATAVAAAAAAAAAAIFSWCG